MELKKNDKIIVIAGVIILIISAIGIALYTSPSGREVGEITPPSKTFFYTWNKESRETTLGEGKFFVNKKTPFEQTFNISVDEGCVLNTINIHLTWTDDVTYGIIKKKGLDTLDAKVVCNGKELDASTKGNGDYWFNFTINEKPEDGSIEAKNESEVEQSIKDSIYNKNSASFTVTVRIETGERLWRLLKYLKDKGNDFDLSATYTYYYYTIEENTSSENSSGGEENVPQGGDIPTSGHGIGEFYRNLGYGIGMI
ncbi:MAG TPA: hypothetical protein ENI44_00535 [Thermoplasmatales archaeon]|nr:hypothetical protein [Thermoplasmatales archaeon]